MIQQTFHNIDGQRVAFGPQMRDLFAALFNARGGIITRRELENVLYGNRLDGGPDAPNAVDQQITILREKLAKTDFRIINYHSRGWALTRLPEVIEVAA